MVARKNCERPDVSRRRIAYDSGMTHRQLPADCVRLGQDGTVGSGADR